MRNIWLVSVVVLLVLLFSCTQQSTTEPKEAVVLTATPRAVISATQTEALVPTATETSTLRPTMIPSETATATPAPITDIQYQNITIENSIPLEIDSVLVIEDYIYHRNESYLLNLQNGDRILFPERVRGVRYISSDRKLLAYLDRNSDQLQIVTADGQPAFSYPIQEDWYQIMGWLDNERLSINTHQYDDGIQIVFNVYTGEWQRLLPSFPYTSDNGEVMRDAIYDPTLSRAIVSRFSRDENRSAFELWDHQAKQVIWAKTNAWVQSSPIWSPSGEYFATVYMLASEQPDDGVDHNTISLYLISYDGQEMKLTNRVQGGASWSPDGRYIATLWRGSTQFDSWDEGAYAFAVIDTVARSITVYSIVSSSGHHIWSPDGRYVALDNVLAYGDEPEETETQVVIVDLVENRAFAVVQDSEVVGWMIQSP